jgi:hypothetical protein
MKAKTFDRMLDSGETIVDQLDLSKARRVGTDAKRVNVDFPAWMVDSLDRDVRRHGCRCYTPIEDSSRESPPWLLRRPPANTYRLRPVSVSFSLSSFPSSAMQSADSSLAWRSQTPASCRA